MKEEASSLKVEANSMKKESRSMKEEGGSKQHEGGSKQQALLDLLTIRSMPISPLCFFFGPEDGNDEFL
jgi:hypothetical protein